MAHLRLLLLKQINDNIQKVTKGDAESLPFFRQENANPELTKQFLWITKALPKKEPEVKTIMSLFLTINI